MLSNFSNNSNTMINNKLNIFATVGLVFALFVTTTVAVQAQGNSQQKTNAAAISGKVVDAQTSEAVTGIDVKLQGAEKTSQTNEKGAFTFAGVQKGTITIVIDAEGYEKATKEVEVSSTVKELTIKLQPSESSSR